MADWETTNIKEKEEGGWGGGGGVARKSSENRQGNLWTDLNALSNIPEILETLQT